MSKICCFTGHRVIKDVDPDLIIKKLEALLVDLIENEHFTDFRAGGAVGFDSIAALVVLNLKERYPHIKLHLILPCKNQDKYFTKKEKTVYRYILSRADDVCYLQEKYSSGVMLARNNALVNGSDLCVAFMTRLRGGTYQTVNLARKNDTKVISVLRYN